LKISTNKIYAGIHWTKRREAKDSVLGYATAFCRPVQKVGSYPVEIRYRFLFRTRPLDTLNTALLAKMFEDALCALGVLEDDDPKHVARSILEVDVVPKGQSQKKTHALRPQNNVQDEDWLEILITNYKP